MIPQNFQEWKTCITVSCKIQLTTAFAEKRLSVYEDHTNPETQKFLKRYGQQHLSNIISWYKQVLMAPRQL